MQYLSYQTHTPTETHTATTEPKTHKDKIILTTKSKPRLHHDACEICGKPGTRWTYIITGEDFEHESTSA